MVKAGPTKNYKTPEQIKMTTEKLHFGARELLLQASYIVREFTDMFPIKD